MKITFFIGSLIGGGAEKVVCELASYLARKKYEVETLIVTTTEKTYELAPEVKIVSLDKGKDIRFVPVRLAYKILNLFRYIISNRNNFYVVFLPETIDIFMIFRSWVTGPVIISERNNPAAYSEKIQKRMLNAIKRTEGIVFQTEEAKSYYKLIGANICSNVVIPNAVREDFIDCYNGERRKSIVAIGRFNEQKNFGLLIRAFAKIAESFPEYMLEIYGEGKLKDIYIKLTESLDIANRVLFPGFVEDIKDRIQDASLFVLSSDYEGIPNALMEAMALGLPCIATNCGGGGAKLLIQDGKNGLLVPVNDTETMAQAMHHILKDEQLAKMIGKAAADSMTNYSPSVIYKKWEDYILEISNK